MMTIGWMDHPEKWPFSWGIYKYIYIYGNVSEYELKPLDDMMYTIFGANCQTCLEKPWMSVLCSEVHYERRVELGSK